MLVDSHIHLYPPEVSNAPEPWAKTRQEEYWLSCVSPSKGKGLQRWKTIEQLIEDMNRAGVDRVVILSWYWENHDTCIENQKWLSDWLLAYPDRLIAFAPFNARGGKDALRGLEKALTLGFRGIGELNPPAQGYRYDDATLHSALSLVGEREGFANFHVTDPSSPEYPGKIETPFESLYHLAENHTKTRFIFAHLGGFYPVRENHPPLPNVFYDLAAFPLLYSSDSYRVFSDKVGADRILFGTDYPLKVFPKSKSPPDFELPIQHLRNSDLDASAIEKILGGNAARLFNLA